MLRNVLFVFASFVVLSLSAQKKFSTDPILTHFKPVNSIQFNYSAFADRPMVSSSTYQPNWSIGQKSIVLHNGDKSSIAAISELIKQEDGSFWIQFEISNSLKTQKDLKSQTFAVAKELEKYLDVKNAEKELRLVEQHKDELGEEHLTFHQYQGDLRIIGQELKAHTRDGQIALINGDLAQTDEVVLKPSLDKNQVIELVKQKENIKNISPQLLKYTGGQQQKIELALLPQASGFRLVYSLSIFKDVTQQWLYIVDAVTGEIIESHSSSCKFHYHNPAHNYEAVGGPTSATEPNLAGQNVRINVYEEGGINYLLNVSESMFNAVTSDLPNEPVGGILTLNANNTSPTNDNFSVDHITSANNRWSDRIAVTAHDNATQSYKYFENNFSRSSFDAKGSTIYSFINVSEDDGTDMDNAFWNGFALFYGNGNRAFKLPLAAAKDVAAHEMAHGVIQNTANLNYQGESGALNESFADIFGVLIDRDDWTLGEEVVNRNVFPSGALRSLSNPNNGGRSLDDPGYQPKSVSEQYRDSEDNGGVHINSGIPNHAFYLFASNPNVGLARAEQIYYKALRDYLRSSSQFVHLRLAIKQSIVDLFGDTPSIMNPFNAAFDQVGIIVDSQTPTTPVETKFEANPGDDFVLWYKDIQKQLVIRTILGEIDDVVSTKGLLNTASISDDGEIILFIGLDSKMYALLIDWQTGEIDEQLIEGTTKWRNVAISRDGEKIAALTGDLANDIFDNKIIVFDLVNQNNKAFELFNPTTAQNVKTGDVLYADAMHWDHTSQFVMYDASNQINSLFNDPIRYWDIGFLRAYDNDKNTYDDGQIFKLFPSLPENVSVGNPTFSNISPDIIALDVLDGSSGTTEFSILGVNLETGDQGTLFENNTVGYPNYSRADDLILFNVENAGKEIIGVRELAADAINGQGQAFIFVDEGIWGTWFANGQRNLSTLTEEYTLDDRISITPNPTNYLISIDTKDLPCEDCHYTVFNNQGISVINNKSLKEKKSINVSELPAGVYQIVLSGKSGNYSQRFVKM